jgi:hypothetical protein
MRSACCNGETLSNVAFISRRRPRGARDFAMTALLLMSESSCSMLFEVGHARHADAALVQSRRLGQAPQRRVAAVAAADDADAVRVGDLLVDQVLHAGGDVLLHRLAPLAVAGLLEMLAEAGRAAELRLEHRVAVRREDLHVLVESPAVARLRAAVDQHDRRRRLRGLAGQRQVRGIDRPSNDG